ncbi:hypothetical protein Pcinc_037995 [Petrolisthes cinctipes]|uniref:Uncharacterized protein n=1 Tax=Petrolisthes cinctipes TaxID=88211 RepID=A0AAE1BSF5_PETCI|nr:hypothetical protein Pcinc_037995 [Petrolisthes cinctipes]
MGGRKHPTTHRPHLRDLEHQHVTQRTEKKHEYMNEISMESEGLIHATQGAPWRQENFAPRHTSPHKQHNANKPPKKYDGRKHSLMKKPYGKDKKEKGHRANPARMH